MSDTKMIPIAEALQLTNPDVVQEQIQVRHRMRSELVGTLYPSILADEIVKLVEYKKTLPAPPPW